MEQATFIARAAAEVLRRAVDVLLPPLCLGCKAMLATPDALCAQCWREIEFIRAPLCDRLGIPLPYDPGGVTVSAAALANPPDFDRARAVARFEGITRRLVHGLKYADRHEAVALLARWMAVAARPLIEDAHMIVPVPLNRWRLWSRRFNQAAILAQALARLERRPYEPMVLTRPRRTPTQVGMTADQRRRNVQGAFHVPERAREQVAGANVVLVDDVITTGATVSACARALKAAGAARVDVVAVAMVTDPRATGL